MPKLKETIIRETPGLASAQKKRDDFEAICQIREWVYKTSNIAHKQLQRTMHNMGNMQTIDAEEATTLYKDKMLGSSCGGTNTYLAKVYRVFSYNASTYNFGPETDGLTHQICIVKLNNNVLLLQDAHFNGYFACNGRPMSFLEAEKFFEQKRPISFVRGKNRKKCRLLDKCITPNGKDTYICKTVDFGWDDEVK